MEFNNKCYVVDAICGSGKTTAVINMINNSDKDKRFLIITPYLTEVERYKRECPDRDFRTPPPITKTGKSKLSSLKQMIKEGKNIVSTHALFNRFDGEIIEICRMAKYDLILDEVASVIENYDIGPDDFVTLMNYVDVDEHTRQLVWKKSKENYRDAKFADEKRLCDLGSLVLYPSAGTEDKDIVNTNLLVWTLPVGIFNSFRNIYILTYLFDCQYQKYYYDYYGLKYEYLSVEGDSKDNYHFVPYDPDKSYIKYDYSKLIHIEDDEKLNDIGSNGLPKQTEYLLSKNWYDRMKDTDIAMKTLKNNLTNFFNNRCKDGAIYNLWTCFKDYQYLLRGRGYSGGYVYPKKVRDMALSGSKNKVLSKKVEQNIIYDDYSQPIGWGNIYGFAPMNVRATNDYVQTKNVAYPVNRFMKTGIKNFFVMNGIKVDEEQWALSEMLQFIFRSALRTGHEITIYVPSVRMRRLLENWIKDNPVQQ